MTRLTIICISFIIIILMFAGQSYAQVDPETVVGIWLFDEGGGDVAQDSSGNGNDGTLNGPEWTNEGKFGGALEFNGADSYIEFATGESMKTPHLTIMAWFNTRKLNGYGHIFQTGNDWDDMAGYVFRVHQDGFAQSALAFGPGNTATWLNGPALEADTWYHMVLTYDGTTAILYLDGENVASGAGQGEIMYDDQPVRIGVLSNTIGSAFDGFIDEVALFDVALEAEDIEAIMNSGLAGIVGDQPFASRPNPEDGSLILDTWVNLSWSPGDFAVSHDVYLGDNFDDVNEGTGDTFRGNQTDTFFVAGFPGFPYPDGLVPGTTYYWRIDEVNDANVASPWKGPVWSFSIPPKKAYDPDPANGAKFTDPDVTLSWTPGFGAKLHTMYFGNNFDDVNSAAGGTAQTTTTYAPGTLELETDYYWRVDEFDGITTHKGDVWSFRTTIPGLGKVIYETWQNIPGTDLDALKDDPRYPGSPTSVEELTSFGIDEDMDDYGGRIHGWLYVPTTGDYTFWLASDDEGELWLSTDDDPSNVVRIAHEPSWAPYNSFQQKSDPVFLVGGNKYYISALWKEGGGGDNCQVAWQGPGVPTRVVIAGSNLSPYEPVQAFGPNPKDGGTGVTQTLILSWKPGKYAASHQVYFGADEEAVKNATTGSPEYKGSKTLGSESYDPGKLAWFTTYYWRVDEVNNVRSDSPWIGKVWSFTTADFIVVDDFEAYNDIDPGVEGSNRIFMTWIDGYDTPTNGSQVGYLDPPFCEQSIVHSGGQSMPLFYNNSGPAYYSEATLPLTYPRDWTEEGVGVLTLWLYGDPANAAESMYVAVTNATGPTAVVYHDNPDAALIEDWTQWDIDLEEISNAGVSMTNVDRLAIGFGNRNNPQVGGTGMVFIDEIRLYRPSSEPKAN